MKQNFASDKYWIIFGIVIIILTFLLYPSSPYNSVEVKLTRSDAVNIAKKYLSDKDIDISGYSIEGFVSENQITNKYLIRELGNEGFTKLLEDDNWKAYGWTIYFHLNISR